MKNGWIRKYAEKGNEKAQKLMDPTCGPFFFFFSFFSDIKKIEEREDKKTRIK